MNPVELVLKTLKESADPLKASEVAELSGLDQKAVDKAMNTLKREEKIVSPRRCYWAPK